ncbi:DMT family transporter [Microbaculum sp. FT89]|uniref:DMT family transporter n=1 Tax=Microbaculum sp. FT89 TaxID=3447298 RepID=UPI003F530103
MSAGTVLRLVAVMVLWASCFPLITIGLDLAPHLAFAAMRAALAGACLLLLGIALHRPVPRGVSSWGLIAVVAAGTTSLGFFGMFHAAEFIAPGLATVIANAQPLLAAVLAHAVLGERLKSLGMTGLALGFAGIVAIAWPGLTSDEGTGYGLGIGYVALAAAGVAIGNLAIKRLTGKADAIMAMGFQMLIGAVPLALLSVSTEEISSQVWSAEFVLVLLVLSVLGTSLAFWLWFSVLREVDLSRANAFTFLVPILGLAIGATLFRERLDGAQAIGVVLVLAGIVFLQRGAPASGAVSVADGVGHRGA